MRSWSTGRRSGVTATLTATAVVIAASLSAPAVGATVRPAAGTGSVQPAGGPPGAVATSVHAAAGPHLVVGSVCIVCRNPFTVTAGTSFKVRVAAKDALGQTMQGYWGTVALTSTDPAATFDPPYEFTPADKGVHVFSVTLRTVLTSGDHKQTVKAYDKAVPTMTGTLGIVVDAAVAVTIVFTTQPVGGIAGGYLATPPAIQQRDAYGNPVGSGIADVSLSLVPPPGVAATFACTGPTGVDSTYVKQYTLCSVDRPGAGFRFLAIGGSASGTSEPFDMSEGPIASAGPSPSLTLAASATTVAFTQEVTFTAALAGAGAGRLVSIERREAGSTGWAPIGTITTDAAGTGSLEYLPARTAEYRAAWAGAADLPAATSASTAVSVKFQVIVSPSTRTRTTTAGRTLKWTATVRPKTAGIIVRFRLYRLVDGEWVAVANTPVVTNSAGKAVYSQKFSSRGRWSVVITALAGPANDAGTAPRKYVTVQ